MSNINQLSAIAALADGDLLPVWDTSNGDARKVSLSEFVSFVQSSITGPGDFVTEYSAPSANAFTAEVDGGEDGNESVWLVLTPTGTFATGTVKMPLASGSTHHGQEVLVNCTQIVTALTVDGNGATVTGAPTALAANDFFRVRFDAVTETWYRVG